MREAHKLISRSILPTGKSSALGLQAEAERRLLGAGLQEATNQRFLLLSESCVPLYPPAIVWSRVLTEPLSRINACADSSAADVRRRMTYRCPPSCVPYPMPHVAAPPITYAHVLSLQIARVNSPI